MRTNKPIAVVDGTWLCRRQYHVIPSKHEVGIDDAGEKIYEANANQVDEIVVSFLMSLFKFIKDDPISYTHEIVVGWDKGTWKYRPKEQFTEYKEKRVYDDSFQPCWDANNKLVDLLRRLGINSIQIPGVEADDLGMHYSHLCDIDDKECTLWSSDGDWLLSLRHKTKLVRPKKPVATWSSITAEKPYIVHPFDLALEKAIEGDSSDSISGTSTGLSMAESMLAYTNATLPEEQMLSIARSHKLARIDYIIDDIATQNMIKFQESLTCKPTQMDILSVLNSDLPKHPPYFIGVLTKYNNLMSM